VAENIKVRLNHRVHTERQLPISDPIMMEKSTLAGEGRGCTLGGFNVSNLMGIKRRMIDIGKKITFFFLQNAWKCTVLFAFAFKVCNKCYYDPKKNFLKNINMGIKKRKILC
jgi:hypothetical protein